MQLHTSTDFTFDVLRCLRGYEQSNSGNARSCDLEPLRIAGGRLTLAGCQRVSGQWAVTA